MSRRIAWWLAIDTCDKMLIKLILNSFRTVDWLFQILHVDEIEGGKLYLFYAQLTALRTTLYVETE